MCTPAFPFVLFYLAAFEDYVKKFTKIKTNVDRQQLKAANENDPMFTFLEN